MSPEHNNELFQFLTLFRKALEQKQGWGTIESWRYSHFKDLEKLLQEKTGVSISYMTLIRILQQMDFKRSPQTATLDALAQYLDFADWASFSRKVGTFKEESNAPKKQTRLSKRPVFIWLAYLLIGVSGLLVTAFLFYNSTQKNLDHLVKIKKIPGENYLPAMLVFQYKVPSTGYSYTIRPTSFTPKNNSKKSKKKAKVLTTLSPNDSLLTINLKGTLYPGSYELLIVKEDKIVAKTPFLYQTKDWVSLILITTRKRVRERFRPTFYQPKRTEKGYLQIPDDLNETINETYLEKRYETNFFLAKDFGVDANNLEFETRI
ncbi:MAG: hypothetical protein AAF242_02285, partial [Bacteroidota bacterium]